MSTYTLGDIMVVWNPGYVSSAFLFLNLLVHKRDAEVVARYVERGMVTITKDEEDVPDEPELTVQDVSSFEAGIGVDDQSIMMRKVRQIRDMLDNSVRHFFGKNKEVDEWVEKLGGYNAVQKKLIGRSVGKRSTYQCMLKKLSDELGYEPSPLGDPTIEVPVESATNYSSYAVQVHREVINKRAHGELEDDDTDTLPNWMLSDQDFDCSSKPWWWRYIHIGRFRAGVMEKKLHKNQAGEYRLKQNESSSGIPWMLDIRLGESIGVGKHISLVRPYFQMEDHPVVKNFIQKFYNAPRELVWKKLNRWTCGMKTPKGKWVWCPLTKKASSNMDYWLENDGKKQETWNKRALYLGDWIYVYKKSGEETIRVWKYKETNQNCDGPGALGKWADKELHFSEWGKIKRKLLKAGAKDGYFGYPDREPKKFVSQVREDEGYYQL
jgi:hypothetical protein